MSDILLANNAKSTLTGSISATDTSIGIQSADASLFPLPTGSQWFPLTIADASGNREIVKCTARSAGTLTVVRAQEGTAALAFSAGDSVSLRLTNGALEAKFGEKLTLSSVSATVEAFLGAADPAAARLILDVYSTSEAAALDSPALTGTPTTTTPDAGDNSDRIASTAYVRGEISTLISGAPGALDTLDELAAAFGDDANFAATMTTALAGKAANTLTITAGDGLSGGGQLNADFTISVDLTWLGTHFYTETEVDALLGAKADVTAWDMTGQSLQPVSRSGNTTYQNTTGLPIVAIVKSSTYNNGGGVGIAMSPTTTFGGVQTTSGNNTYTAPVAELTIPAGYYYRYLYFNLQPTSLTFEEFR